MFLGFELNIWVAVGFLGQLLFFTRFIIQWIASERKGESVIPVAFWYFSISGALIILIYAIYRNDPVFIVGQGLALLIYTRNLILISRNEQKEKQFHDTSL